MSYGSLGEVETFPTLAGGAELAGQHAASFSPWEVSPEDSPRSGREGGSPSGWWQEEEEDVARGGAGPDKEAVEEQRGDAWGAGAGPWKAREAGPSPDMQVSSASRISTDSCRG